MAQTDFTIADVLAWARTKPAEATYNYQQPCNCALTQFLKDTARAEAPSVWTCCWIDDRNQWHNLDERMSAAAKGRGRGVRQTFGKFVKRLESIPA